MKRNSFLLLYVLFLLCFEHANAQFSYQIVNSQQVSKSIRKVAYDNNGNLIIAGSFAATLPLGGTTLTNSSTDNDVFIAKQLPGGSYAWVKKITLNALTQKKNCSPTSGAELHGLYADANGDIYLTGSFRGSVSFGTTTLVSQTAWSCFYSVDMFTAKMSASGTFLWAKAEGTNAGFEEFGNDVTTDNSGNVYAAGTVIQSVNTQMNCGSGTGGGGGTPLYCAYVVKYSPSGTKLWERKYNSGTYTCSQAFNAEGITTDGTNAYVLGVFYGTVNFGGTSLSAGAMNNTFILKLDAGGNTVWVNKITGTENYPNSSSVTPILDNGNADVYIATSIQTSGTASFGNSISVTPLNGNHVLAKYATSNGSCTWATIAAYKGPDLLFKHPNGNIGFIGSDQTSSTPFDIKEFSSSGVQVNVSPATNPIGLSGGPTSVTVVPGGYVYSQDLRGSYDRGATTIASTQSATSSYRDMILVRYTTPPPIVQSGSSSRLIPNGHTAQELSIYPNPTQSRITISSEQPIGEVSLFDLTGRQVFKVQSEGKVAEVDMTGLPAGSYLLRTGSTTTPFKIQKL